ncbi:MAG: methionyl-tRNA formyltransferase, partial [Patescibacteria group bacterium]
SPVKVWADEKNIEVIQPLSLKPPLASSTAEHTYFSTEKLLCSPRQSAQGSAVELPAPVPAFDLALVASYGKILPPALLDIPRLGFINIHPSLIPKYRGATPLEASILSGDTETGVTLLQVDEEMDHGLILAQEKITLTDQNYFTLRDETAKLGAQMFARILPDFVAGKIRGTEQNHTAATYTKKITKADGEIDLTADPSQNYRKIKAFSDWPGTYFFTEHNGQPTRILIKKAHLENNQLIIDRVLPEGKKEMDGKFFK